MVSTRTSVFYGPSGRRAAPPVSSRVQAVEDWFEQLAFLRSPADCGPEAESAPKRRVLFILDNDFGELTTVLYLVLGQPGFRHSTVLLSSHLFSKNRDALPGRLKRWRTEADLLQAIEAEKPHAVVLASGYLMPVHELLSSDAVARVCRRARDQGATVVTADPFLGLLSQPPEGGLPSLISIAIPEGASKELVAVKKLGDERLHTCLGAAEEVLREAPHLYPAFTRMDSMTAADSDRRNLSFFNDALLLPAEINSTFASEDVPHWMFLISQVDYQTQCMFMGAMAFARRVARLLTEAARLGRRAIFLGPGELLELVHAELPSGEERERIHLLKFCAFRRAMAWLLTAEYCFYWNVVSHTILMQLWNGRPVVLLDRGHLARAIPTIYERVMAWYYQGWEPPYLDPEKPLTLDALEAAVAPHRERRDDLMARYRDAPSPSQLLETLTSAGP